jgi:hypothetical protein
MDAFGVVRKALALRHVVRNGSKKQRACAFAVLCLPHRLHFFPYNLDRPTPSALNMAAPRMLNKNNSGEARI